MLFETNKGRLNTTSQVQNSEYDYWIVTLEQNRCYLSVTHPSLPKWFPAHRHTTDLHPTYTEPFSENSTLYLNSRSFVSFDPHYEKRTEKELKRSQKYSRNCYFKYRLSRVRRRSLLKYLLPHNVSFFNKELYKLEHIHTNFFN